ncbi:MAG: hypothetical protein ACKOW3_01885 [Hyphomicrobium sp.]
MAILKFYALEDNLLVKRKWRQGMMRSQKGPMRFVLKVNEEPFVLLQALTGLILLFSIIYHTTLGLLMCRREDYVQLTRAERKQKSPQITEGAVKLRTNGTFIDKTAASFLRIIY